MKWSQGALRGCGGPRCPTSGCAAQGLCFRAQHAAELNRCRPIPCSTVESTRSHAQGGIVITFCLVSDLVVAQAMPAVEREEQYGAFLKVMRRDDETNARMVVVLLL